MGGDAAEVEREILVQTVPSQAPDHDLYLYRVTVPPGAQLPAHTHPGTQAAHIQSGTLTYQVLSGSAVVVRAAQGDKAATPETVTAPVTVKLRKGDAVIENPQLVHQARNDGKRPVVILLSSLLTKGAPLSEPVG
jgi:quercetin dioxygenase-like cupin family protein